jgi:CHASE3 domain sensor protein
MTQDEIMEIVTQAHRKLVTEVYVGHMGQLNAWEIELLKIFAKLVEDKVRQEIIEKNAPVIKKVNDHIKELQDAVKAEREACAKLCEEHGKVWAERMLLGFQATLDDAAKAIRARGNT